ncbi:hypothetical protein ES703_58971 [subsurface metagenome]
MPAEPIQFKPKVERRREILYGTPGIIVYKDDKPVLWIPDDFGSLTKNLLPEDLEALLKELRKYLESPSPSGRVD